MITTVFTGLPVSDIEAARAWYERLLGRPPDLPVNDNESAWQLAGEAWMYIIGDAERAGRGLLAPIVDDLEATVAGLASRGIDVGPIEPVGSAGDRTVVIDPDGNWLGFTQVRAS